MSGLNAGGSYRPLIVEMALSTPNFLTCSLWAVNTVIAEDRLLYGALELDQPALRPEWGHRRTGSTLGVIAQTGRLQTFVMGPARSEVYPFSVIYGTARGPCGSRRELTSRAVRTGRFLRPCGLRVRRQALMRTMTASSRELQAAPTASLADSARLATCGRTLSPPPAMKGSHGSHRPHAAPPWEGRSARRRSAWDDCGKARRPLADPGPSPGRWR